jgi:soluble lytic murein transglycosylase-like protein
MRGLVRKAKVLFSILILFVLTGPAFGQIYSYLDDNGVRVFTNIAPAAPVRELKISGAQPPAVSPQPVSLPGSRGATTGKKPSAAKSPSIRQANPPLQNQNMASLSATASPDAAFPPPTGGTTAEGRNAYAGIIEKYSNEYGVDPQLIHSMIATESAFNPGAVSPKGAQGLMQLMPGTAAHLGVANPFDPEENISGGIRYMRSLLDMFSAYPDTLKLSLAAYNAGENLVRRLGRVPAIRETNNYVQTIIERYGQSETELRDPMPSADPSQIQFPTFRYFDEKGILVLTNIPPVLPSGSTNTVIGSKTIFR